MRTNGEWGIPHSVFVSVLLALAWCPVATAQQAHYAAVARCTSEGGVVSVTLTGMSTDTCIPFAPRITVTGDRIDLQLDHRLPPNTPCGDQPTGWCFQETTGLLPSGTYRVFTSVLPEQPIERSQIFVPLCPQNNVCTPAPIGSKPDGVGDLAWTMTTWDPDGSGPDIELLVVAGRISDAGGAAASSIATWNGTSWGTLGTGITGTYVTALTVFRGELIAAGIFNSAGGTPVANIARWDGLQWSPLGTGVGIADSSAVYGLTVFRDELVAVGRFAAAGGVPARNVARWDGIEWRALGAGVGSATDSAYAATVFSNELIVAGRLRSAGGAPARSIARWDGVNWTPMDAGAQTWTSAPALAVHDGSLFASVTACPATGCTGSVLEWVGASWQPRDAGLPARPIGALTSFHGQLIASTGWWTQGNWPCLTEQILQWDRSSWTPIALADNAAFALLPYNDELIIAGALHSVDDVSVRGIARLSCTNPACPADFNADGAVNSTDFFDFLTAFFKQAPIADFNHDTFINSQDFFEFLAAFFAGC
ncbi:MAG: hypothetical protein H7210_13795 [Pyrinomonadaceae bacterium]|nr:hypothetical protein [Phycisphaerales bacterium]